MEIIFSAYFTCRSLVVSYF